MGIANLFENINRFLATARFRLSDYVDTHPDRRTEVTKLVNSIRKRDDYKSRFSPESESGPLKCIEAYIRQKASTDKIMPEQAMNSLLESGADEKVLANAIVETAAFQKARRPLPQLGVTDPTVF